jgi:hypothetical protein
MEPLAPNDYDLSQFEDKLDLTLESCRQTLGEACFTAKSFSTDEQRHFVFQLSRSIQTLCKDHGLLVPNPPVSSPHSTFNLPVRTVSVSTRCISTASSITATRYEEDDDEGHIVDGHNAPNNDGVPGLGIFRATTASTRSASSSAKAVSIPSSAKNGPTKLILTDPVKKDHQQNQTTELAKSKHVSQGKSELLRKHCAICKAKTSYHCSCSNARGTKTYLCQNGMVGRKDDMPRLCHYIHICKSVLADSNFSDFDFKIYAENWLDIEMNRKKGEKKDDEES